MANSDPIYTVADSEKAARKGGRDAFRVLLATCLTAFLLNASMLLLPTSAYQRWEIASEHWYEHLLWCFERIHFDPTPIDIAIIGSSKAFFAVDPYEFEQKLAEFGVPAHVANLAKPGVGRNAEWAIVKELLAVRKPGLLIVGIEDQPYPRGYVGFKDIATVRDLLVPPAPLLHNYFSDLISLPKRQARLFAASYLPQLFGLNRDFDPRRYKVTPLPWSADEWLDDLVETDRNLVQPAEKLLSERQPLPMPSAWDRVILKCWNDGDEKVYLRAIAIFARAKGVSLLFVHTPMYQGSATAEEANFVRQFGPLMDGDAVDDLRNDPSNFENWRHFNRIGAKRLTDRLASLILDIGYR